MHNKKVLIDALKKLGSAKAPSKPRDIITDPMGQWKFPGQNTRIPSNDITMEGVPYPVYAQPNVGPGTMMYPGQDYHFPDADYVDETPQMKAGGALLTKKVTCKKCGWKWDAADGGDDITTCHKCGGQGLVHAQGGGDTDAMNGMMKARLAYANEFGNPAAKRMINLPDNPYQFDNGDTGTHYMASMDNYAVPQIQDEDGQLMLGDYGPESDEAMRFESDEDANYFAENYKDVSPGFMNIELTPKEIEEYAKGGYIIEDVSVPQLTQAQKGKTISDPKEYAYRKKAYNDSLSGYNKTQAVFKALDNLPINDISSPNFFNKHAVYHKADEKLFKFMSDHSYIKPSSWKYTHDYLGIPDVPMSYPLRTGIPVFKKPKQPVVFKNKIVPTVEQMVTPAKVVAPVVQPKPATPSKIIAYKSQTVMYPDGSYELRRVPYYEGNDKGTWTQGTKLNPPGVINAIDLTPEEQQSLKNKNKLNSKKEGGALPEAQKGKTVKPFVVSEKEKKIYEDAYNKKYPPIILNDPNDPRIGWFTKEGNKYIYVPLVKKEILIKPTKNQIVPGKIIRKPGDPKYVPYKENGGELEQAPGGGQVARILKNLTRTNNVISRPIKKIGYNIAAQSALPYRTGEEIRKGILGTSKDKYFGQVYDTKNLYGPGKRDLNKLYFFGDDTGFEPIDYDFSSDTGLNKMVEKYGPLKAFLLNSTVQHNEPLNAFDLGQLLPNDIKYNINFHELNNLFEKHESDIIPFEINSKDNWYTSNPINPIDNIAGHMAFLKRLPNEEFELTTRDLWGFRPEAYNDKWKMDNVFKKAQTQMMDKFGKPFVLTQTNPIEFQKGGDLPKAPGGGQVSKIIKDLSNLTAGKALRTTIYKGVNPANYNVMEKFTGLPSELYRNTVNNSTRPFRTGLSLRFGSPDHLAPFLKDINMTHTQWNKLPEIDKMNVISAWDNGTLKQINDVGRRRLDAWAVALKQPQEYNTLEQIGDNKYRMLDLEHDPEFFGARHNDIIVNDMKGQDFVGKRDILTGLTKNIYDLEKDPFQLQMNSDDPLANLKRSEFDKLTNNKVLHRPWQQTYHVEPSPDSEFENALYDNDHYGVRGGYRWDVKDTPEGMHWQANDVWDLNPWEKRTTGTLKPHPLTKKYLNANYFKPLQNVEALGLVGGSPFSIENNFIVDPENYKIIKQWEDGGSVDYELGDEIDEATMRRLEKLGYTFEKV
jgi:hypothetical protein